MPVHPTLSFEKPAVEDQVRVLPPGVTVRRVMDASRRAALAFVSGSAMGWDGAQLRSWFDLDYLPATAWSRAPGNVPPDPSDGLDDVEVAMVVDKIRVQMVETLQSVAVNWKTKTFARDMVHAGLAVAIYDRFASAQAYAPGVHADMRLKDRVMSLFVADYLSRAPDYDRINSCDACGELAIGSTPRHLSWCAKPPTKSGVIERRRHTHAYGRRYTIKGVG